jgi:hypothetical protein
MSNSRRIIVPLLAAAVGTAPPAAAGAQTTEAPSDSSNGWTTSIRAAIGTTANTYAIPAAPRTPTGVLGLQWQRPASRLSARLELAYQEMESSRNPQLSPASCGSFACSNREAGLLAGLSLNGQFDLSRSAVRPYLVGGVGFYRSNWRREANFSCTGAESAYAECTTFPDVRTVERSHLYLLAAEGGAGVGVQVGRATFFGEARYTVFNGEFGRDSYRLPLLIGVRF